MEATSYQDCTRESQGNGFKGLLETLKGKSWKTWMVLREAKSPSLLGWRKPDHGLIGFFYAHEKCQ